MQRVGRGLTPHDTVAHEKARGWKVVGGQKGLSGQVPNRGAAPARLWRPPPRYFKQDEGGAMKIRAYAEGDADGLWAALEPVLRAGETYAIAPDISRKAALAFWCGTAHEVYVAVDEGVLLGSFFLRANTGGHGDHVVNAAFVTQPAAQGKGVARRMLDHALERSRARGFRAMQFNFVVASNQRAISIWQDYGFDIVGRLPQAFRHPTLGLTDALVMHRFL